MDAFPFSEAEWTAVKEAALPIVNAELADDSALRAAHFSRLLDVLAQLRKRHGDHPVLLETEADFAPNEAERIDLYRRAVNVSQRHGLQTLSIRLSLARLLLDRGQPAAAAEVVRACAGEAANGDESERRSWAELAAESGKENRIVKTGG